VVLDMGEYEAPGTSAAPIGQPASAFGDAKGLAGDEPVPLLQQQLQQLLRAPSKSVPALADRRVGRGPAARWRAGGGLSLLGGRGARQGEKLGSAAGRTGGPRHWRRPPRMPEDAGLTAPWRPRRSPGHAPARPP
jgi:hypothetical protein